VAVPSDPDIILALGEDLPIGLWVARAPRGELIYANRTFSEITGTVARDALYSTASYVRPDRQGRFVIAEEKRSEVSLATEITVVGAVDRVEIWDRKVWAAHVVDAERVLKMEMDTYSGADPDDLL